MSFNLLGSLVSGATGLLTGGPIGAAVGAVAGGLSGSTSTSIAGNGINGLMQGIDTASELDQAALYAEQARHNSAMQWDANWFNEMMDQRSETMRESNSLRTLSMEQRKEDNKVTQEFIKSIAQ